MVDGAGRSIRSNINARRAQGKGEGALRVGSTAVDNVVFWSAPAERSGDGADSGVRRQSEAPTPLSDAGNVQEHQPPPEPKRCRASLATAVQRGAPETGGAPE